MSRLEASIEDSVCDYAEHTCHHIVRKINNRAEGGWPDRVFVTPWGRHYYIEFKRPDEPPRPLQRYRIGLLIAYQCEVFVVDNVEEGKRVVNYFEEREVGTPPISRAWHKTDVDAVSGRPIVRPWTG